MRGRFFDRKQHGAVAIEFAVLSILFVALIYAIATYAVSFFLTLTLNHLSAEAARSAIRVDPALPAADYRQAVSKRVTDTVTELWSSAWIDGGCDAPDELIWTPLPPSAGQPSLGYLAQDGAAGQLLHVCLRMGNVPLPRLPGMGDRFIPQASTLTRL